MTVVWKPDPISIDFGDLDPSISLYLMISSGSYIKHLEVASFYFNSFLVVWKSSPMKHSLSCLIYYMENLIID